MRGETLGRRNTALVQSTELDHSLLRFQTSEAARRRTVANPSQEYHGPPGSGRGYPEEAGMTRRELVERVREGLSSELSERQVAEVIERALSEIGAAIQRDGKVTLPGFGTFTVRVSSARIGRNPQTGEAIEIPAASTVGFKPAAELRAGLPDPAG